jgi:NitT/TauT family transport system permease protein
VIYLPMSAIDQISIIKTANYLRQVNKALYYWPAFVVAVVFFSAWQLGSEFKIIPEATIASPMDILHAFQELVKTGELWMHIKISLYRIIAGFLFGSAAGMVVGVFTGWFPALRRTLNPILSVFYGFPKIALLPFLIIVLGTGDTMRIVLLAIMTFFPMWINTEAGVLEVDKILVNVAKNFGANEWQVITKVAVHCIVPYIVAGLKYSAGLAIHLIVIAEMINADKGIGYLIWFAGATFDTATWFLGIFILIFFSVILLGFFNMLERWALPWKSER